MALWMFFNSRKNSLVFSPLSPSSTIFAFTLHDLDLTVPRWRTSSHNESHALATHRRSYCHSARMVPRPSNRILLHQPRLRNRRTRRWTPKLELPNGSRVPNHRTQQGTIPGNLLLATSPSASKHSGAGGRQCHDSGCGDCSARSRPVQRKYLDIPAKSFENIQETRS
jgi:hypothetical protein